MHIKIWSLHQMKKESLIQLYFTFQIHTLTEEVHFSKTSRNLVFLLLCGVDRFVFSYFLQSSTWGCCQLQDVLQKWWINLGSHFRKIRGGGTSKRKILVFPLGSGFSLNVFFNLKTTLMVLVLTHWPELDFNWLKNLKLNIFDY